MKIKILVWDNRYSPEDVDEDFIFINEGENPEIVLSDYYLNQERNISNIRILNEYMPRYNLDIIFSAKQVLSKQLLEKLNISEHKFEKMSWFLNFLL